mgnify:CR=1 FL=1
MTKLIKIENLHYRPDSFPPEKPDILKGINLEIDAGSFVAIIGENGSGKTTLLKHLNALLLPTQGRVLVETMDTSLAENTRKLRALIGMVFQNPADQIVSSTVEEDIAFGLENLNMPTVEIRQRVSDQLFQAGLENEAARPPHLLSGGQIQKLALAGVLARQPRIILFDEPTSMLDPATREAFLNRICELHHQGMTIIYVTHHMEEAVHADKVVVLEKGKVILEDSPGRIFTYEDKLREAGLEIPLVAEFSNHFRNWGWKVPERALLVDDLLASLPDYSGDKPGSDFTVHEKSREEIIAAKDIHYTYLEGTPLSQKALFGVDFTAADQSVHGLAGTNGSGKSTFLQHLNGILRPSQGTLRVGPYALEDPQTPLRDVIKKVGLVFQNPETQFFEVFVGDEIAYGAKQFEMDNLRDRVRKAMSMVGLDFDAFKDRRLETLSGGEKRKVALASTLILNQDILLFDEPTAGMDPRARDELLSLFHQLNKEGKTIIIASHRLGELALVTQDISIMQKGTVIKTGPSHQVFSDTEVIKEGGLLSPLTIRIANKLIEKGWPIAIKKALTPKQLLNQIEALSE